MKASRNEGRGEGCIGTRAGVKASRNEGRGEG